MNKDANELMDKWINDFIEQYSLQSSQSMKQQWEAFKSSHQPPSDEWEAKTEEEIRSFLYERDEWEVVEYEGNEYVTNMAKPVKVRRLSDNATLEVGKEYEIVCDTKFYFRDHLKRFEMVDGELRAIFSINMVLLNRITSITEVKTNPVLFLSEDGVQITGENEVALLNVIDWTIRYPVKAKSIVFVSNEDFRTFSTEAAAKRYVDWMKPDKSLAMIREAAINMGYTKEWAVALCDRIKSKLKTKEV